MVNCGHVETCANKNFFQVFTMCHVNTICVPPNMCTCQIFQKQGRMVLIAVPKIAVVGNSQMLEASKDATV